MTRTLVVVFLLSLLVFPLSGCGQGAPLYSTDFESPVPAGVIGASLPSATSASADSTKQFERMGAEPLEIATSANVTTATLALTPGTPDRQIVGDHATQEAIEKAKADLAGRLDIPTSEIKVILVIGLEFTPDGFYCRTSKGKTAKDEPSVMISAETILLEAQGIRYEYHANGQVVVFCPKHR